MKKKHLLLITLLTIYLSLSGCLNYNYAKFFPDPPSADELLQEKQSGELANPIPEKTPDFENLTLSDFTN